jgi:hypothetical protein
LAEGIFNGPAFTSIKKLLLILSLFSLMENEKDSFDFLESGSPNKVQGLIREETGNFGEYPL